MSATASLRCSLGDLAIYQGSVRLRQWGPWTALVECSATSALPAGEAVSVVMRREDGTEDVFAGAVRRSGVLPGSETLVTSIIGGAGKLLAPLSAVPYAPGLTPITAGLVVARIAADAGERLAPGVEAALDARALARWHRAAGVPGWQALDLIAAELDYVWRALPSGEIWMGAETWPTVSAAPVYLSPDPDDGATLYAPDGAPVAAGQTLDGVRLVEVVYDVAPGRLRLRARGLVEGDPPRALDRDLYMRVWPGKVLAQRADGTLDVRCDDTRIGELLALPLRLGLPGCKVTVREGTRVRVAFEGASPAGAFASWVDSDDAASAAMALVGDGVHSAMALAFAGTGTISLVPRGTPGSLNIDGTIAGPGHRDAKGVSG